MRLTCLMLTVVFTALLHEPASAWWVKKKNWPVHAKGRVTCHGQPMRYVRIKLMDDDPVFDDTMGSAQTNNNGYFSVSGSGRDGLRGKPDPYIKVIYQYSGQYGKMEIERIFGINRWGKSHRKGYAKYLDFGTINFKSIHCISYVQFYKALRNYSWRAKRKPPYSTLHVRTNVLLHGGTPYALYRTVKIPRKTSWISYQTAKHELAHTVRHSYDGGLAHFLFDVARYKYTQHHSCGKNTNWGFAFNEGWAEYWAGECYFAPYGSSISKSYYRREGNVADALRKLQAKCHAANVGPAKMVDVLRRSGRRRIHNFYSFNWWHYRFYKCKL